MYVDRNEIDREVLEIKRIVAEAVGKREDRQDRNCSRPEARLPGKPRAAKPAPPDDMMPAPPL